MPDHNWLKVSPFRTLAKIPLCRAPDDPLVGGCMYHGNAALRKCPVYRRNF